MLRAVRIADMARILYVEDNQDSFRLVQTLLQKEGHAVTSAANGLEALDAARQDQPDLILMDLNLPGLNGLETTAKLKCIGGLEDVPVVAISAKTLPSDRFLALAAGCSGYIPKPIDPFSFTGEIDSYLQGRVESVPAQEQEATMKELQRKLVNSLEEKLLKLEETNLRLQDSEALYRILVENVHTGIWYLSPQRRSRFMNQRMRDMLCGDLTILHEPSHYFTPRGWRTFQQNLDLCMSGEAQTWETSFLSGSGQKVEGLVSCTQVLSSGMEFTGFLVSVLDITEKKRIEQHLEQVQKLENLSALTAGIAHDFKNIVGIIATNAELLQITGSFSADAQKRINSILGAAARAREITARLLSFSRETPYDLQPLDPVDLVRHFCQFFQGYKQPNISLVEPEPQQAPSILADAVQMGQVFLNLAANAQDAMPEGGTIEFAVMPTSLPEFAMDAQPIKVSHVCFSVRDTGMGMNQAVQERIFEPFFTTKSPDRGSGLGLSAVQGIVKRHNGRIEVDSQPGRGTEFRVFIPIAEEPDKERDLLLLIEPDPMLAEVLTEMLEPHQLDIRTVQPDTAASSIASLGPRWVLVDDDCPLATLQKIADACHTAHNTPWLVLLTGYPPDQVTTAFSGLGYNEFISKPFNATDIALIFAR